MEKHAAESRSPASAAVDDTIVAVEQVQVNLLIPVADMTIAQLIFTSIRRTLTHHDF